jgi:nucleotide-binding universal stress UspA family protein
MKNILIPTDLTDCTRSTLKYAIRFSSISNTKLFFYHISEKPKMVAGKYLKEYINSVFSEKNIEIDKVQTEFIVETGEFSNQKIKRIIKKYSIDLVIMGASHDAFKNTFFGSYVSDLINEVSCPVLSIPHGIYKGFKMQHIGFASELFDLKKRIKAIIPFAKLFNSEIEVFHVYPVYPEQVDVHKFNAEKILDQIKHENDYDKITIDFIKTSFDNEPVKGITKYINNNKPDLLVMSHKPRGLFDKLTFDSGTTASVVKTSSIPILLFNKKSTRRLM